MYNGGAWFCVVPVSGSHGILRELAGKFARQWFKLRQFSEKYYEREMEKLCANEKEEGGTGL